MIHEVRQGECLSAIAAKHGLSWRRVWNAPQNESLRKTRKDPNVLLPGDVVHLPEREPKTAEVQTDQSHRFRVHLDKVELHLRLVQSLEALPDEPYVLQIEGRSVEGRTDGEGKLHARVPARLGTVILLLPERRQRYTLSLGHLDPATTLAGAQARLRNLGLYQGRVHGEQDEATASALATFQREEGIEETGTLDDPTAARLRKTHGS